MSNPTGINQYTKGGGTFREYMAKQAKAAKAQIKAAKRMKGGISSGRVQGLFNAQDIVRLNAAAISRRK